jgi:hypothetical protein
VEALRLALVLSIVVICVLAATRPQPHPRTSSRSSVRQKAKDSDRSVDDRPRSTFSRPKLYRNRWDRSDIARAVGRDFAEPDSTLYWPIGTVSPRV